MSSLNKTPHYNLSQFGDSPDDKPSWRGDYTADMSRIDAQMYRNATDITTATAAANNANTAAGQAKTTADDALGIAQANKTDIAELDGYFSELGVTSAVTAQNLLTTINGKADSGALAGKVDAGSVYTKGESDSRYLQLGGYSGTAANINSTAIAAKDDASMAKSTAAAAQTSVNAVAAVTTDLTELVWIGDSLSTGYQPGAALAESKRIPQLVASKLGLNLHVFANNASGYGKAGDGVRRSLPSSARRFPQWMSTPVRRSGTWWSAAAGTIPATRTVRR